jgi:DNA-directed RNA polymerase specialized sigma24 family protein
MNDLIAKLKDENEAAFKEVMAMYKKPIYNYLSLLVGDRQVAEELTQDTFILSNRDEDDEITIVLIREDER